MKIEILKLVDTSDFQKWAKEKYGMSNHEWHEKIWNSRNGLCGFMEDGPFTTFSKGEDYENKLLEEHINAFIDDFPELNGEVSFIFTN